MPFRKGSATNRGRLISRIALVQKVEWSLVAVRYLACIACGAYAVMDSDPGIVRAVALFCLIALLHNGFVHWVMYRKQYQLFTSLLNFADLLLSLC